MSLEATQIGCVVYHGVKEALGMVVNTSLNASPPVEESATIGTDLPKSKTKLESGPAVELLKLEPTVPSIPTENFVASGEATGAGQETDLLECMLGLDAILVMRKDSNSHLSEMAPGIRGYLEHALGSPGVDHQT